jgi:hypothetical protein
MNIYLKLIILTCILITKSANSAMPFEQFLARKCLPTPTIKEKFPYNKYANPSNDLTINHNNELDINDKAIIYGRLLDRSCRPIADTKIKFWQNVNIIKEKSNFEASAIATTNNIGEFLFTTFLPSSNIHNNIIGKMAIIHEIHDPMLISINLTAGHNLGSNNLYLSSSWLYPSHKLNIYNSTNVYHIDIVMPLFKDNIRF